MNGKRLCRLTREFYFKFSLTCFYILKIGLGSFKSCDKHTVNLLVIN